MTTIDHRPEPQFRVCLRSGSHEIGATYPLTDLTTVKATLAEVRRAYADSAIQMRRDPEFGDWEEMAEPDLDRFADVNAALALAAILDREMPRIDWSMPDHARGRLTGHTNSRTAFDVYLKLLGVKATATDGKTYTHLHAAGVFLGAQVDLSCSIQKVAPQNADQVGAVSA